MVESVCWEVQDETGKVGLGWTDSLKTTAMNLDLSTGSSLSLLACPILRPAF